MALGRYAWIWWLRKAQAITASCGRAGTAEAMDVRGLRMILWDDGDGISSGYTPVAFMSRWNGILAALRCSGCGTMASKVTVRGRL